MATSSLPLSVTIITLNEEKNLRRALTSVQFAREIIVVDSGSTDQTITIAKEFGAKVTERPWPGYGAQKNFAHSQCSQRWVLNLDADEEVTPELAREIESALQRTETMGFRIPRKTFFCGRWIRYGGWYPNLTTRLCLRDKAKWSEPTVHETLQVQGPVHDLKQPMNHYTFNSISEQVRANLRYSEQGTQELERRGEKPSYVKLFVKPIGKWFETYVWKLGFMDGLAGWIISFNAAHSIFLKYARLFEKDLKKEKNHD